LAPNIRGDCRQRPTPEGCQHPAPEVGEPLKHTYQQPASTPERGRDSDSILHPDPFLGVESSGATAGHMSVLEDK
jgi:hypothetical protein